MKSNNTYLNILSSYAYLGKNKNFTENLFNSSVNGDINVMIDSGAFTLFNAKQNRGWLTLDTYCDYLEKYSQYCEKYVMLDVIGNDDLSKENYEKMLDRGFNPMFVFTMVDNDYEYLKKAVNNNKHLCVAGGVTTKGDWMTKRFQDVYKQTSALIHGLGYVTYPKIFQLPLHSVDSSSWIQASQIYGTICYFDNGMKGVQYSDILKNKKKLPYQLQWLFERFEITPKMLLNIENSKGNKSIQSMMSIIAYLEYQKLAKRKDLNLFLAVSNDSQLNSILNINEMYNTDKLTYERFKNK